MERVFSQYFQSKVRTSAKTSKSCFLFRGFYYSAIKSSISLYGQRDPVRTRKISETETEIDAQERKKSTIGAEYGNRTRTCCLGSSHSATKLIPRRDHDRFIVMI